MAASATVTAMEPVRLPTAGDLLDVVERCLHARASEWMFFRELRLGSGRLNSSAQRLDALALNCYTHQSMKRICYEVKMSRADFRNELRNPVKRRAGMRYSNEFYFLAPYGLLPLDEIPPECGLIEVSFRNGESGCAVSAPAPWRDTPGPTWQIVAAMLRHQQRRLAPPAPSPSQMRLTFD